MVDNFIPYGKQTISDEDIAAVVEILKSDLLTQGPAVSLFEKKLSKYVGADNAVAVNSGTSALHLACLVLGLGEGDWLWTTPITFVASSNCALYCGAQVDFVDIDPFTYNLSIECLKDKLINAEKNGSLPKVVVVVHFGGLSCDMKAISELSDQYGFSVIEDACHAIGGKCDGRPIGSCDYSDVTVFSFHPVKNMTTGEGGAITTNNPEYAEAMMLLRSHGITRDQKKMTKVSEGAWYYQQTQLGFNYRLTDIQAALGVSQLKQLDQFVARRNQLANVYDKRLSVLPLQMPARLDYAYSAYHLYVVRVDDEKHHRVFEFLRRSGIGVNLHYIPIHLQPYYKAIGFSDGDFPEAEKYYREAITLPLFPGLTEFEQGKVVNLLEEGLRREE